MRKLIMMICKASENGFWHNAYLRHMCLYVGICLGLLSSCNSEDHENIKTSQSCLSGFRWNPDGLDTTSTDDALVQAGKEAHIGAGEMYPGRSCIGCHTEHDGPKYVVAGTVFTEVDEASDCTGFGGVIIEITDANGSIYNLISNSAGNFYLPESEAPGFAFPYRAKAIRGERSLEMTDAQDTGDCASCHTATGEDDADGRIIAN